MLSHSTVNVMDSENVVPVNVQQQHAKAGLVTDKRTVKQLECEEPILKDNPSRFVLFPIKYQDVNFIPYLAMVV